MEMIGIILAVVFSGAAVVLVGMVWVQHRRSEAEMKAAIEEAMGLVVGEKMVGVERNLMQQMEKMERMTGEAFGRHRQETVETGRLLREEVGKAIKEMGETAMRGMGEVSVVQKNQLEGFGQRLSQLTAGNEQQLGQMRKTLEERIELLRQAVEQRLGALQQENTAKLEQMRLTVDEKLQGTLEKRLGESFKLVSERLEMVHKGLGEMQGLAAGVGDLKKVLTNVKTRGTWGEVQLGNLLEQVLAKEQYEENVEIKQGSRERVEFAVKLPARGGDGERGGGVTYLPIDAKFPVEDYQRLVEAMEAADVKAVEEAMGALEVGIKRCGKEISEKYICPPVTTDFGLLFLPTEGLYAEVVRRTVLVEYLRRQYRVEVAGPSTLWAILSALQQGFRTLAIEKRSAEVWQVLGAVKTEFGKFGEVLTNVKSKLEQASNQIESMGRRTRVMEKTLRTVEQLPAEKAKAVLGAEEAVEGDGDKLLG